MTEVETKDLGVGGEAIDKIEEGLKDTSKDIESWFEDPLVGGIILATILGLGGIAFATWYPEWQQQQTRYPKEKNYYIPVQTQTVEPEKTISKIEKPLSEILKEKRIKGELIDRENYIYYFDPRSKKFMKKPKELADFQAIAGVPVED